MSTQNISNFITAASDTTYLYENTDIDRIAPLLLHALPSDQIEHIKYIGAIGRGNIGRDIDPVEYSRMKILDSLVSQDDTDTNKFVGIYNTGSNHWISFIIYRNHDLQSIYQVSTNSQAQDSIAQGETSYMVWFKDSLGEECRDFQDDIRSILAQEGSTTNIALFSFNGREQILEFEPYNNATGTHIHTNCGVFALRNMIVLASKTPLELTPGMQGFFLQDLYDRDLRISEIELRHNYEQSIKVLRMELPKFYIEHGGEVLEGEELGSAILNSTIHTIQNSPLASTLVSPSQLSNDKIQEPILLDFFDTKLTLEDIKLKREIAKLQMVQATEIAQLQQIEVKLYAPLIKKLAYTKSPEELQVLSEIFEDLGSLTIKLVEFNGSVQEKLKHYTDAAVLYQYVLTMLDEKSGLSHTDEVYITKRDALYSKLASIKFSMMSVVGGLDLGVEASLQSIKSEIDSHKAMLNSLRKYAEIKVDEIENYRILSQSANNHEIREQLQVFYVNKARGLFHNIAKTLKEFLATFYQEAEKELKTIGITKPCDYGVIGLGSLALKQATPYSDLEFAIITENNVYIHDIDPKIREYFKNLTHLVHFKMIGLGETIVATSKYGVDLSHLVHRGVNFDLGGKTPLGRIDKDKPYDLIGTQEWLMHYVRNKVEKASHIDKNLPYILENVTHVYGNELLTKDYQEEVTKFLSSEVTLIVNDIGEVVATEEELLESKAEPYMVKGYLGLFVHEVEEAHIRKITMHHCEVRALKILKEGVTEVDYININRFSPSRAHHISGDLRKLEPLSGEEGKLFDVKQEIYRLPDRLIYSLGLHYGIQGKSGWNVIEQLHSNGIISEEAKAHLKNAITFATTLRLKTYLHNNGQIEDVSLFTNDAQQQAGTILHLSQEDLSENGVLFEYFYTALPLHYRLEEFCDQYNVLDAEQKQNFFLPHKFYANVVCNKGLIYYRLGQDTAAQINFEMALQDPSTLDHLHIRNFLGVIYNNTGKGDKAIEQWQYCLSDLEQHNDTESYRYADIINNLGMAHYTIIAYFKAEEYFIQSLNIKKKINTQDHHVADSLSNLGMFYCALKQYDKAIPCLQKSISIYAQVGAKNDIDIVDSLISLGVIFQDQKQYDLAEIEYKKAWIIQQQVYKGEPHPNVANTLNHLGIFYQAIDKVALAIEYYVQSITIYDKFYTELHPMRAAVAQNLASVCYHSAQYKDIIRYMKCSSEMYDAIYPNILDINNAHYFYILGEIYGAVQQYDTAKAYYLISVARYNNIYNNISITQETKMSVPDQCVGIYYKLGEIAQIENDTKQRIEYFQKSLEYCSILYPETHIKKATALLNLGEAYAADENYNKALYYCCKALKMILLFQDDPQSHIIQNDIVEIIREFTSMYLLDFEKIAPQVMMSAIQDIDFSDYIVHYRNALLLQQQDVVDVDGAIEEYRLAHIFLLKGCDGSYDKEIEYMIYSNIARIIGTNIPSIALWFAISHGIIDNVTSILQSHEIDVNITIQGITPLIPAVIREYKDIILRLMASGAKPNIPTSDGDVPMHMAHYIANPEAIRLLLQYHANINAQNYLAKTPLHCLLEKQDINLDIKIKIIAEFLPKYNLTIQDLEGKTAVDYAAEYCPETLSLLLRDDVNTANFHDDIDADNAENITTNVTTEQQNDQELLGEST